MTEHYTKNTLGTLKWCNTCRKQTMHAVSGKRVGRCTEHGPTGKSKKQEQAEKKREAENLNPKLF
jgi:hypothetical protein